MQSSVDIGNPIYNKQFIMNKWHSGRIENVMLFDKNDSEVPCDIFYAYTDTPEGMEIEIDIDISSGNYNLYELPNYEEDVRHAITEHLKKPIYKLIII